ncbi:DUF2953 domain-containing protein [Anaerocolumna jejuensis]|uniref:DUF2953 domain-containing protein n=1 Tax=Anaerocolumna jejuensis TaxID=259063 RepID=UPI003F7B8711
MIHIVFIVLKIIGIILASVLGLLIALILIALFVPIRYKLNAEYEEDFKAAARFTWLLRIVSFTAEYGREDIEISDVTEILEEESDLQGNFRMRLKIFGKILFDSSKKEEEKEEKASEKKKRVFSLRGKKGRESGKKTENGELSLSKGKKEKTKTKRKAEEGQLSIPEAKAISEPETAPKTDAVLQAEKKKEAELTAGIKAGPDIRAIENSESINTEEKSESIKRAEAVRITKAAAEAVPGMENNEKAREKEQQVLQDKVSVDGKEPDGSTEESFHFIRKIGSRIKNLWNKLIAFFESVKKKVKNLSLSLSNIFDKYNLIKSFFQNETNKLGLKYGFERIKGLLKHMGPRKVKAYIEFGTGDPCSTGQLLGVAAAFMGIYKDSVQIIPDFENEVLKGNFYCKGRIRGIILLIIGIKVIRNRDIRALIKNFQTLKEEF